MYCNQRCIGDYAGQRGRIAGAAEKVDARAAAKPATAGANATALANQVLNRWQPIAEQVGLNASSWRDLFSGQFALMHASALQALDTLTIDAADDAKTSYAKFAEGVRYAVLQTYMLGGYGKPKTKLGSSTTDQVFVPITPCRIVDTRNVGGPISAGFTRNFYF